VAEAKTQRERHAARVDARLGTKERAAGTGASLRGPWRRLDSKEACSLAAPHQQRRLCPRHARDEEIGRERPSHHQRHVARDMSSPVPPATECERMCIAHGLRLVQLNGRRLGVLRDFVVAGIQRQGMDWYFAAQLP
jgi:hypothetical protein